MPLRPAEIAMSSSSIRSTNHVRDGSGFGAESQGSEPMLFEQLVREPRDPTRSKILPARKKALTSGDEPRVWRAHARREDLQQRHVGAR